MIYRFFGIVFFILIGYTFADSFLNKTWNKIMYLMYEKLFWAPFEMAKVATMISDWSRWRYVYTSYCGLEMSSTLIDNHYPAAVKTCPKIAAISKIAQNWIYIPSLLATCGCALECFSLLDKKFSVIPKGSGELLIKTFGINVAAWVGFAAWVFVASLVAHSINNYFCKLNEGEKLLDKPSSFAFKHPLYEFVQEAYLVTRVVLGVGCLAFGFSYFSLLCVALESAALVSIAKRRWVKYSIQYQTMHPTINKISFNLFMRLYQISPKQKEDCGICLDELNGSADKEIGEKGVFACKQHMFHLKCINEWFNTRTKEIIKGVTIIDRAVNAVVYSMDLKTSAIPNCPNCRGLPSYEIEGTVEEKTGSSYSLKINLKDA